MSDVKKINGYDIKDETSRENILDLQNDVTPLKEKSDKTAEIHFVYRGSNGGDASIIKTKDKVLLIDFGKYDYVNEYIDYLIENDITKIDYVNISHFDNDHTATLNGFRDIIENTNLDFSECIFILHQAPDWESYIGDLTYRTRYEEIVNYLTSNNYIIKYPTELEEIELDSNNKLKFYNVDTTFYSDYLTSSANAFSIYIELISNKKHLLFTGDGIEVSENNIYNELNHIDLLKIPHHGVETNHSIDFMKKINPDIGVIMNTNYTYPNRPMYRYFMDNYKELYTSNESHNIIAKIVDNEILITSTNGSYSTNYNNIIQPESDLDDIRKDGIYICNTDAVAQTLLNLPYNYQTQFIMKVEEITINHTIQTIKTINVDNVVWTRKYVNGTWTTWQRYRISTFNYLRVSLTSNNQSISDNTWNKILFNNVIERSVVNDALTLDDTTGNIVIGKGVHHVRVTSNITWNSLTAEDRINMAIYKNNDRVLGTDDFITKSIYTNVSSCVIAVSENDKISTQVRNLTSTTSSIDWHAYSTSLEVSVID